MCIPLTSALRRKMKVNLCEIKPSLVYISSSRPAGATGRSWLKKEEEKNSQNRRRGRKKMRTMREMRGDKGELMGSGGDVHQLRALTALREDLG